MTEVQELIATSTQCEPRRKGDEAVNLKRARKALGKTQGEMADLLGVKAETYRYWEKGFGQPQAIAMAILILAEQT